MEQQRYALILGNSLYDDATLARLNAPQGDAVSFAEVLKDAEIGEFTDVTTLVNQSANEIRKSIARFFANRSHDDLLLLYFSGHGVLDDRGRLFLATKDTEHDLLNATAIDAAFITDAMDRSRSNRQVLILDCCHSGAFARGSKGALGASVGTAAAFEGSGSGRVILTATDATQYAWEGEQIIGSAETSVFTHHLVEGLRSGQADRNADGWIALDEWFDYVYERVLEETPKQTPGKWSYKQQGEIWIARNPRPSSPKAALPQELLDTLADPRSWVREGAVAELDRLLRTGSPHLASAARAALQDLLNDDSRRVSAAAQATLSAQQAQSSAPSTGDAQSLPPSVPLPVEPAAAAVIPEQSSPADWIQPQSEPKSQAAALPLAPQKASIFLPEPINYLKTPTGILSMLWCLGWIASLNLALSLDTPYALILGWMLAGLIADTIMWRMRSGARFSWLPVLTLGWPVALVGANFVYAWLYASAGSDSERQFGVICAMLVWVVLGGMAATGRIFSVFPAYRSWPGLLKTILCWGGLFLITLVFTGTWPWETALYDFNYSSIDSIPSNFSGSQLAYYALALNGILSGLIGSYLWYRWVQPIKTGTTEAGSAGAAL